MNFNQICTWSIFAFTLLAISAFSQEKSDYKQGEVMVQLKKGYTDIEQIIKKNTSFQGQRTELEAVELLSETMNIWLLSFNANNVNHTKFTNQIALDKNVIEFQNNHAIEKRSTTPNDTYFNQQWQYINPGGNGGIIGADIDADLAWDITTGGVTIVGDTIVVCIVDDGLFKNQADFEDNLWVNHNEIENNGIDDDNNGYIDDYRGFFANNSGTSDLDNIYANFYSHGTAVAGVVGAKGNNNFGVAGINWNVKLMIVKNQGAWESQVIKAYEYPLKMRNLYNLSNGEKGAFVVAVNSSWGIDNGNPSNFPLWCAFYNEMGAAGILNAGATANANVNVDTDGDMPTACSSDYLISVTNVWRNDQKVPDAGYGLTTIDIGAFGQDAFTVSDNNPTGFDGFGGTSGATPQVAGAIGLLYAAPCPSFASLYLSDPAAAALKAKEYIMNGGDDNLSLQGRTVSGKRLNLNGMMTQLNLECSDCPILDEYYISDLNESQARISVTVFGDTNAVDYYEVNYRELGAQDWITTAAFNTPILLDDLISGTNYQFQIRLVCNASSTSFSPNKIFSTAALSINKLAIENGIKVYPNPTNDMVTISLDELQENLKIGFYDISGKLIYDGKMLSQKQRINISVLESGIYILKLSDQNGNVYTHKITKL